MINLSETMSLQKTGQLQNVSNLDLMNARVATFGARYNPSNPELELGNLQTLKTNGDAQNEAVNIAHGTHQHAIATRIDAFGGFDPFITRVSNAVTICGASSHTKDQAHTIIRNIHGKRASAIITPSVVAAGEVAPVVATQNTVHNADYVSITTNFHVLNQFLGNVPEYNPNEADITVAALTSKHLVLKASTDTITTVGAALDAARQSLHSFMDADNTGLVDIAHNVKLYTKSVFGAASAEYKSISDLPFTKTKP